MNTRVSIGGEVKLPQDVIEALKLEPGNAVSFERGSKGEVILSKVEEPPSVSREQYRRNLERLVGRAGPGPTTDEVMRMTRGDD
jgi:bifunctional DNA-binding transcriptional regulator/antitoxin component of YhaV-PrlF toxin-antitoxin module